MAGSVDTVTFPGPDALGRGLVVDPGAPTPAAFEGVPRLRVDEDVVAEPDDVAAALHAAWAERRRVVVELAVSAGDLRSPERETRAPYRLDPGSPSPGSASTSSCGPTPTMPAAGPPAVKARHGPPAVKARHGPPAVKARHGPPAVKARHGPPAVKARHRPPPIRCGGTAPVPGASAPPLAAPPMSSCPTGGPPGATVGPAGRSRCPPIRRPPRVPRSCTATRSTPAG